MSRLSILIREGRSLMGEGGPVSSANAGPHIQPFGPVLRRQDHDDDLEAAYDRGVRYISGGAVEGDELPSSSETAPAPRRFKRRPR